MNYGDAVHAALRAAFKEFGFPRIRYENDYRIRATSDCETSKPRTLKIDQRSAGFTIPQRNRQSQYIDRTSWTWVVDVGFDVPVSFEEFETFISANPPRVARAPVEGRPAQVDIFLQEAEEYVHPPRQSPSTGSRARYRFVAVLTPS